MTNQRVTKILVVQLRQLGDILLTTPCLRELKQHWPWAHVTFLSHPMGQLILEHSPHLDEHFMYNPSAGLWSEVRLARELRVRRFDIVLDYMNNPRSALYTWATGAFQRLAFDSVRHIAYTQTLARNTVSDYIVREKFRLLGELGIEAKREELILPWFETHAQPTLKFLDDHEIFKRAKLRVVLSATHRREARRWPLDRYAALADYLVRIYDAAVTWVWGPGEEDTIDRARALCRQETLKSPPTSFREMAALIANHDLFIGNSNGPSHVAVAVGIPNLQLHGPTQAKAWSPGCDPHWTIQAQDNVIQSITLAEVQQLIARQLDIIDGYATRRRQAPLRINWRQAARKFDH